MHFGEDFFLEFGIFEDGFDGPVGVFGVGHVGDVLDTVLGGFGFGFFHSPLIDVAVEYFCVVFFGAIQLGFGDVDLVGVEAVHSGGECDP